MDDLGKQIAQSDNFVKGTLTLSNESMLRLQNRIFDGIRPTRSKKTRIAVAVIACCAVFAISAPFVSQSLIKTHTSPDNTLTQGAQSDTSQFPVTQESASWKITMLPLKSDATGTFYQLTFQSKVKKPIQNVGVTLVGSYHVTGSNLKALDSMHADHFYVNNKIRNLTWEMTWIEDGKTLHDTIILVRP